MRNAYTNLGKQLTPSQSSMNVRYAQCSGSRLVTIGQHLHCIKAVEPQIPVSQCLLCMPQVEKGLRTA